MEEKEVFSFDMGDPQKKKAVTVEMSSEEIKRILKTIPQETLDEFGISLDGKGDDTPESAVIEGEKFSIEVTRMTREGFTITDHADFYWFDHRKWSGRGGKKPGYIIPHHQAGNLTYEQVMAIMASAREMSATVFILSDGTVIAIVPEEMRPWTTGSYTADQDALTMEIANDEIGGDWHISNKAYNTAVEIAAEWCKRYGIDPYWKPGAMGTIQMHKEWAPTACPGPYMSRKIESGQFEADIRAILNPPKPAPAPTPSVTVKFRVQSGAFKSEENCDAWINTIHQKGFQAIKKKEGNLWKVQCGIFESRDNAQKLVDQLKAKGITAAILEVK